MHMCYLCGERRHCVKDDVGHICEYCTERLNNELIQEATRLEVFVAPMIPEIGRLWRPEHYYFNLANGVVTMLSDDQGEMMRFDTMESAVSYAKQLANDLIAHYPPTQPFRAELWVVGNQPDRVPSKIIVLV